MNVRWNYIPAMACVACALFFTSCEQPVTDDDGTDADEPNVVDGTKVVFNVCNVEIVPWNSDGYEAGNVTDISKLCTRIELAVFDGDNRVTVVRQAAGDAGFGHVTVGLDEGTYTVVVIAHNGEGSATISSPEQMFRLVVKDNVPEKVDRMKFYYTGGSSTFDAVSGCGCVDSRQTEFRDVPDDAHSSESVYEVYTFPHSDGRTLNVTVSALDASDKVVDEREFTDVPVERNQVTQYSGYFFGESPGSGRSFTFTIDEDWSQVDFVY